MQPPKKLAFRLGLGYSSQYNEEWKEDMALIRGSCPTCGDVEMAACDVTVRVETETSRGEYSFSCPLCNDMVIKETSERTIDLLVAAGVKTTRYSQPKEKRNPKDPRKPISHDDILDAHNFMEDDTAWRQALEELDEQYHNGDI